jgi:hypothetical protein
MEVFGFSVRKLKILTGVLPAFLPAFPPSIFLGLSKKRILPITLIVRSEARLREIVVTARFHNTLYSPSPSLNPASPEKSISNIRIERLGGGV